MQLRLLLRGYESSWQNQFSQSALRSCQSKLTLVLYHRTDRDKDESTIWSKDGHHVEFTPATVKADVAESL